MLSIYFIWLMILAAHQSGKMLQRQGLLKANAKCWSLSTASMRHLMEILTDQTVNLTPKQYQKVVMRQLGAVVFVKFLGKKNQMRIPPEVLRYLMTMGIPRQIPGILKQEIPRITCDYMQKLFASSPSNSVLLDPQGSEWTSASRPGTYSQHIKHMTVHPGKPYHAMIDGWGNVWIGRTDCPNRVLFRIYDGYLKGDGSATTCTFHSFKRILAIGFTGKVGFYEFSDSLDLMVCRVEVSLSSRTEKFVVSQIKSHQYKTIFTVISSCNPAKAILLNSNFDVTSDAEIPGRLPSSAGNNPPFCACFLLDGGSVVTGHWDGKVSVWRINHVGNCINMVHEKTMSILDDECRIEKIEVCPLDPTILALFADCRGFNYVFLVRISPDGSPYQIIQRFPYARHFQFSGKFLLLQSGSSITLHFLRDDYKLVKVLEFTSTGQIESCVLSTVNGEGIISYSLKGCAKHRILQLNGFSEYKRYF
jgi:hypothetical protein